MTKPVAAFVAGMSSPQARRWATPARLPPGRAAATKRNVARLNQRACPSRIFRGTFPPCLQTGLALRKSLSIEGTPRQRADGSKTFENKQEMNGCARPVYLLTPGPLTTSKATKQAMLQDWGSRDAEFKEMTTTVRRKLLELTGDTKESSSALHFKGRHLCRRSDAGNACRSRRQCAGIYGSIATKVHEAT